eukprot:m.989482 g.989482  ORF g.989482 m.989482 type:complete len:77 (-) comp23996_c1_seq28:3412-3642(-)
MIRRVRRHILDLNLNLDLRNLNTIPLTARCSRLCIHDKIACSLEFHRFDLHTCGTRRLVLQLASKNVCWDTNCHTP